MSVTKIVFSVVEKVIAATEKPFNATKKPFSLNKKPLSLKNKKKWVRDSAAYYKQATPTGFGTRHSPADLAVQACAKADLAAGPRAVLGSQRPRTQKHARIYSNSPVQPDALRAEDGLRSVPCRCPSNCVGKTGARVRMTRILRSVKR